MYLKRLIVGGFEKVYEITKVFRNEGVDHDHNPEFTMFEAQIAFQDYYYGMDIIEEIFEYCAKHVLGTTELVYQGIPISLKRPWKRIRVVEAIMEVTGVDPLKWQTLEEAKEATRQIKVIKKDKFDDLDKISTVGEVIAFVFEEAVEEQLIQPTIIYDYPIEVSPLAKKCDDSRFTQRFEYFAFGSELGNNYTELNDPVDLRQRFVEEKKREDAGFDEAHQTDYDYLEAIEHGFPPTCGLSIGIDRMVMLFTDAPNIKEVIAFPTLKPTKEQRGITTHQALSPSELPVIFSDEFASKYPSASVGYAVMTNVQVMKRNDNLVDALDALVKKYEGLTVEKILGFPEIQSYHKMYKQMGVDLHSRRPSPEALLRRVAEGKGLYQVNSLVDAYNLVVLKHRVSLGAFNLKLMRLPISVEIASGGEMIELLGKGKTSITQGEVFYRDMIGPYNLDYNYRDAERTKITEDTTDIVVNVDGIGEITPEKVRQVLVDAVKTIQMYCGGVVEDARIVSVNGVSEVDELIPNRSEVSS
jgi:elongation factor P--beta-lysine ligase/DNA/RNA-binding domain of Phe-tRNA-synthetase-like protein